MGKSAAAKARRKGQDLGTFLLQVSKPCSLVNRACENFDSWGTKKILIII
jgi:hypothetical protein